MRLSCCWASRDIVSYSFEMRSSFVSSRCRDSSFWMCHFILFKIFNSNFSRLTISNCFRKANFLPSALQQDLGRLCEQLKGSTTFAQLEKTEDETVAEILNLVDGLKMPAGLANIVGQTILFDSDSYAKGDAKESHIRNWLNIEASEELSQAENQYFLL